MNIDVITLGNSLVDLLVSIPDDSSSCKVDFEKNEMSFKIGEKILADKVGFTIGGGACRAAIGLSRLGFSCAILSEVGNDELASRIIKTLEAEGVDVSCVIKGEETTSFTVGINYQKDRTLFIHHQKGGHDFDFGKFIPKWFYVASLGEPWVEVYNKVLEIKKDKDIKIAFNPGPAQLSAGREKYIDLVRNSDIIFLNRDEAVKVSGDKSGDIKLLLQSIAGLGPRIVVITDGREGSYVLDETESIYHAGIIDSKVVERTGAGDAYAAGFLSGIMRGFSAEKSMVLGTLNSGSVVTEFGGVSGLMDGEKMKKLEARYVVNVRKM